MEQATIPEFFTARKRPTEGVHAAKRRKTVETENALTVAGTRRRRNMRVAKTARGEANERTTRSRSRTNTQATSTKPQNIHALDSDLQEFLHNKLEKTAFDCAEKAICEVTSIRDDHAFEDAMIGNANSAVLNKRKNSVSLKNMEAKLSPSKEQNQVVSPRKIMSANKVRRDGLKPNPWIAEQARNVFLSRGGVAVARSRKTAEMESKSCSKEVLPKSKKEMKQSRSNMDLEKARELCKTMRSLRTKGESAKDIATKDCSERLHTVASGAVSKETSSGKVPAFERYSSLVAPIPKPTEQLTVVFPLPHKYKSLCDIFCCCDTVLNLLGQRNERCTFSKIKDSVQKMSRKKMEKSHLGQINTVFPDALVFRQEKTQQQVNQKSGYELTIEFGQKSASQSNKRTLTTSEIMSRKTTFQDNLLKLTKKHHEAFLLSLSPPVKVDQDKIKRWHPKFRLDEVPNVEVSELPEPPVTKSFTSAQDALNTARDLMLPRVHRALQNVAEKSAKENKSSDEVKSSTPSEKVKINNKPVNNALKGVSQDLLNKIRQKAAKKVEESLLRDPAIDKKLSMKERLPELCRILKNYFVTERKAAIPLEDTRVKLSESYPSSLSPGQIEDHLWLIAELVPDWLSILTVRKCQYVKINKNADISTVVKKLLTKQIQ